MLVLFCYGYYKSQVGCDKFVFSTLTFRTTFLDLLCQFNFLIDGNKRGASNLNEVFIKCFTRTVCNTFLNLKLSHLVYLKLSTAFIKVARFGQMCPKTLQRYAFILT